MIVNYVISKSVSTNDITIMSSRIVLLLFKLYILLLKTHYYVQILTLFINFVNNLNIIVLLLIEMKLDIQ